MAYQDVGRVWIRNIGQAIVTRDKVKLSKLNENDATEAYLKTFARIMVAFDVSRARWGIQTSLPSPIDWQGTTSLIIPECSKLY